MELKEATLNQIVMIQILTSLSVQYQYKKKNFWTFYYLFLYLILICSFYILNYIWNYMKNFAQYGHSWIRWSLLWRSKPKATQTEASLLLLSVVKLLHLNHGQGLGTLPGKVPIHDHLVHIPLTDAANVDVARKTPEKRLT